MSGGGGQSTTTTVKELAPEQRALLEPVIPIALDYLKNPPQQFPGSSIAGFNPTQTAGQKDALAAAGTVGNIAGNANKTLGSVQGLTAPTQTSSTDLMGRTALSNNFNNQIFSTQPGSAAGGTRGLGDVLSGYNATQGGRDFLTSGALLDPRTNPALAPQIQGAIRPIFDQLERSTLPGIRSDFIGGNMFGSSRQGIAEGVAIGDASRSAMATAANLQANNFNQGLGVMNDQISQAGQLGLQAGSTLANTGVAARGQDVSAATSTTANSLDNILRSIFASTDVGNLALLPAGVTSAVGAEQQGMTQAKLNEEAQKFTTAQMLPFLAAQDVAALAYGMPAGTTNASANTPGGGYGGLGALAGMGVGSFFGPGGTMLGGMAGRTLGDLF